MKHTYKLFSKLFFFAFLLGLVSCEITDRGEDNATWTNDNAMYVHLKTEYVDSVLQNVEHSFPMLDFDKVYVTHKDTTSYASLVLLFVLPQSGEQTRTQFLDLLAMDVRIEYSEPCYDLPFPTVDTRYIETLKNTIAIDETIQISHRGQLDYWFQALSYKGFVVKPKRDKALFAADFPQINIKLIQPRGDGTYYVEIVNEGYFRIIKARDIASRLPSMEKVWPTSPDDCYIPIPPLWETSDFTIVDFETSVANETVTIKGMGVGVASLEYGGVFAKLRLFDTNKGDTSA